MLVIHTINIGNRQDGRVRGNSVIDVPCKQKDISDALDKVLEVYATIKPVNPYYKEHTAENYYKKTKQLLENLQDDIKEPKRFYDL